MKPLFDLLIDFGGMSTCLVLVYAMRFENLVQYTFIFTISLESR